MSAADDIQFLPCICRGGGPRAARWRGFFAGLRQPLHHAASRRGPPPLGIEGRNGFTLIEMLVALAIFSLAALALLRLEGATVSTTARLQDQALAQIVARNIAVEALTDPEPPAFGTATGETVNAGRKWLWTRRTARSPEPRIQQIEIQVRSDRGPEAANLTIFRRAPQ
jgi:general secretion pathway protein I